MCASLGCRLFSVAVTTPKAQGLLSHGSGGWKSESLVPIPGEGLGLHHNVTGTLHTRQRVSSGLFLFCKATNATTGALIQSSSPQMPLTQIGDRVSRVNLQDMSSPSCNDVHSQRRATLNDEECTLRLPGDRQPAVARLHWTLEGQLTFQKVI
jgi:hypothetical protein